MIVDWNRLQGSGFVNDILQINGLGEIAELIGWNVEEIDGHNWEEINCSATYESDKPRLIIARTIKGKGISYMENKPEWHAKWPDDEHVKQAYKELSD